MNGTRNLSGFLKAAPLHLRLVGGIALVLAASLSQSLFTHHVMADNRTANDWVQHTENVLAISSQTRRALLEMESDYRGFLINGDESLLTPYTTASLTYSTSLTALEQLTADNPPQVARWQELERRGAAWQRDVVEPDIALRRSTANAASTGQGTLGVSFNQFGAFDQDQIELLLVQAADTEWVLLQERRAEAVRTDGFLVKQLVWGTLGVLGVGLLIAVGYSRNMARALARVQAGERRYRQMFDNNPAIKLLIDPTSGAIIEANHAACEFYGYSRADLLRRRVSDISALSPQTILAGLARMAKESSMSFEATDRLASGEVRDLDIRVSPVDEAESERGGTLLYAVISDVTERHQAEARLRLKTSLLEARGEASPDGIFALAPDGRILSSNGRFADLCGLPASVLAAAAGELTLSALVDQSVDSPTDPQEFLARALSLHDHAAEPSRQEVALRDGQTFDLRSAPVLDVDGAPLGRVWFFRDMTKRKQAEVAAHKTQEFLAAVMESVGAGIVACDGDGVLTLFNNATRTFHGLPEESVPADQWAEHYNLYEVDGTLMRTERIPLLRALRGEHVRNVEMMILPKHGSPRTIVAEGRALRDAQGHALGAVVAMHDISERKKAEEALRHQTLHDQLTELPNRTLLQDRLSQAILLGRREDTAVALLLLDLDRFKEINDTLGHHYGDLLLRQIGPRLRTVLRASDSIARLGGDEFAVVLPASDAASAVPVAELLLRVLKAPFMLDGQTVEISGSIGVASYPAQGSDAETLLRQADVAMYVAKHGQSGIAVYALEHDRHTARRLALGGELRLAIENHELVLHYQPKVRMSGHLAGVEALVRWRHPQRGLIAPDEFIGLAEHIGLIRPLTRWVLDTALRQCRTWLDEGAAIKVAVNVSMHDLHDETFPDTVARLLVESGVAAEYLGIEITEGAIMSDAGRAMSVLTRLHALGVSISVDDFGTGYSSLAYLKQLPVDELKIDRSFVFNIANDEEDAAIVRSTIGLGHELGLTVVAEGVEDRICWDRLKQFGCDLAQGYFMARPLPAADLDSWLADAGSFRAEWQAAA